MRANLAAQPSVRTMPDFKERRTVAPRTVMSFASQLASAADGPAPRAAQRGSRGPTTRAPALDPADLAAAAAGVSAPSRQEILDRAGKLLGIPYVWGGNTPRGLDCSSYVSRAWGVGRQTTDTLSNVADNISKDELRAGDAMNLPTWNDPHGYGHVRLFDRWADPARTKMWVYEETADTGNSVHRMIPYDARYQPMRLRGLDTV
ncbi:MAG TPA: NlpC/P60 family protein [Chloroflexota bacterium]